MDEKRSLKHIRLSVAYPSKCGHGTKVTICDFQFGGQNGGDFTPPPASSFVRLRKPGDENSYIGRFLDANVRNRLHHLAD